MVSIAIFTFPVANLAPWDPDSIHGGITGSEEAVIYMSQELAALGYRVTVYGDPPEGSRFKDRDANPRYLPLSTPLDQKFDIGIAWRMPQAAPYLKQFASKVYLWPHDAHDSPLSDEEIESFAGVLWLTEYQRARWVQANPLMAKFTAIFGNGIDPSQFAPIAERENPYSCIYGSNYARGLSLLLDFWPAIKKRFPRATLDIYYGWNHWGLLSPFLEAKMRRQVAAYTILGVIEHGLVGHRDLNEAYGKASFWTYPCQGEEVFCITALRAQMSGAIPVILDRYCLNETVLYGYSCLEPSAYLSTLLHAMEEAERITLQERESMRPFILENYTWKVIAEKWKREFEQN